MAERWFSHDRLRRSAKVLRAAFIAYWLALTALLLIQSIQATGLVARNAKRLAAWEEVQLVRRPLRRAFADVVSRRHG